MAPKRKWKVKTQVDPSAKGDADKAPAQQQDKPEPVDDGGVDNIAAPVAYAIPIKSDGFWDRVSRTVKQSVMKCFCLDDEVGLWDRQDAFDKDVARERLVTLEHYRGMSVTESVVKQLHDINHLEVKQVPRFVGHVVDALRIKLGMGAADPTVPGNRELVRREAAKIMRDWNVRHRDAAAHLLLVERAFFTEGVHERPTTWRVDSIKRSRLLTCLIGERGLEPKFDY